MASPATPILTPAQYEHILTVLSANPTAENRPIREEIAAHLAARKVWTEDAVAKRLGSPS